MNNLNFYDRSFWQCIDELINQSKIIVDRPKNSAHPRFKDFVYKVDYGYLDNTTSADSCGIDVFVGSEENKIADCIVCCVDLLKRDSEIKILYGCTDKEKEIIYNDLNNSDYMKCIFICRDKTC